MTARSDVSSFVPQVGAAWDPLGEPPPRAPSERQPCSQAPTVCCAPPGHPIPRWMDTSEVLPSRPSSVPPRGDLAPRGEVACPRPGSQGGGSREPPRVVSLRGLVRTPRPHAQPGFLVCPFTDSQVLKAYCVLGSVLDMETLQCTRRSPRPSGTHVLGGEVTRNRGQTPLCRPGRWCRDREGPTESPGTGTCLTKPSGKAPLGR